MRAPVRPIRGRWPAPLERRLARFLRPDPALLLDPEVSDEAFREGMASIHVGDTIKITGADRHPGADDLVLEHVQLAGRTVVDIGASDGSTSVDLVTRLPDFGRYVIADLYLTLDVVRTGSRLVLFDPSGECVLVSGRRLVAWPALSRAVALLYRPVVRRARAKRGNATQLLLLNPRVRRLMRDDPRVTHQTHDVFAVWPDGRVDVMKIANLLRRLYFPDADIARALVAVHAGLADDGHLLLVDNPRIPGIAYRAGLYRRTPDGFEPVARTPDIPEIDDLVAAVQVGARAAEPTQG